MRGPVGPPIGKVDIEVLAVGGDDEVGVADVVAVHVGAVALIDADDLAQVGPVESAVGRGSQSQNRVEALRGDGGDFGVIDQEELACSGHPGRDQIDGSAAHVVVTGVEGIDRRIGIGMDGDIDGRLGAERIVQRADGAGDGPVLVVAEGLTLPELAGMIAAVAAEKHIAPVGLDDSQFRIRPGEAVGHIGERRPGAVSRGFALGWSDQFPAGDDFGGAEIRDGFRAGRDGEFRRNRQERDHGQGEGKLATSQHEALLSDREIVQ